MENQLVRYVDAARAAELAGISLEMLNYLSREGLIAPSGSAVGRGRRRLYTFGDVVTLRLIGRMLRTGLEVRRLKRGLATIHDRIKHEGPEENALRNLATDGLDLFVWNADGSLESLTSGGQLSFGFLIDLVEPRAYLRSKWEDALIKSVDGRKARHQKAR
jgi:DNA-binding transcriptional MerR regulator